MSTKKRLVRELAPEVVPLRELRRSRRHLTLQRCLVWSGEAEGEEGWRCIAYNVSTGGIGLTLPLPVRPGNLLTVKPYDVREGRVLKVRVVRTTPVDWLWFCGGEFVTPLSREQLQAWLDVSLGWLPCDVTEFLA